MYTYESFETLGEFTLFRPVFITMLIASILLLVLLILPRTKKYVNGFLVVGISIILTIVSAQLLWYSGVIVDELGLGGDAVSTYIFIAILALAIVNSVIYIMKKK